MNKFVNFITRGYIKIPGAVSKAMVDRARQAMNHSIGSTGPSKEDLANNQGGGGFGGDLRGQFGSFGFVSQQPHCFSSRISAGRRKPQDTP